MKRLNGVLAAVPRLLASKPSIIFLLFLLIYLFGFGMLGIAVPALEPSATMQLVLGNWTNVTSALGASIAAGASVTTVTKLHVHVKSQEAFRKEVRDHIARVTSPEEPK